MMATYNGERYVSQQIDSILGQIGVDVSLRICDDGSTDGTCAVCEGYAAREGSVRFTRNEGNLGCGLNFMQMVWEGESAGYDYLAFSDQDDVWLPGKLARAIDVIEASAQERAGSHGVLYYSDYTNVDASLGSPRREKYRYARCAREGHSADTLLIQNWAPGCTMVFDQGLRSLLCEYRPEDMPRYHDSWVHLVANYAGAWVAADLGESLILRRITGENEVGEGSYDPLDPGELAASARKALRPSRHAMAEVARQLLEGYGERMSARDRALVRGVAESPRSIGARVRLALGRWLVLPNWQMQLKERVKLLVGRF